MPDGITTPLAILGRIAWGKSPDEPLCWTEYLERDEIPLVWTKNKDLALQFPSHCAADKRACELSRREECFIHPLVIVKPMAHRPIPDPFPQPVRMDPRRVAQCRRDPVEAD